MQQVIGILFLVLLGSKVDGQRLSTFAPGKAAQSGRIVNGTNAAIENFPFIVILQVYGSLTCGASIITAKNALTAGHCLENRPSVSTLTLRGGSSYRTSGGVIFPVSSYVVHPNYDKVTTDYDAAIVTIADSFAGYQNIAAIALQNSEIQLSPTSPTWCYALGWGYTNGTTKTLANNLQFAWLQLLPSSYCEATYGAITDRMLCTQYAYVDMCNGDSGGPLVCNGNLTGIVSFGTQGCPIKYPIVFGKVASPSIRSFIRQHAGV